MFETNISQALALLGIAKTRKPSESEIDKAYKLQINPRGVRQVWLRAQMQTMALSLES